VSFKKCFLGFLTLLIITGCSNVYDVSYDYEESYPISALKTFDWLPLANKKQDRGDAINFERIQNAIVADLSSKGLTQSSVEPDFQIEILFGAKNRARNRGRSRGRGSRGGGYRYKEGYLSIDFVDPGTDGLIWHGTARAALEMEFSPKESERIINEVVGEIMRKFPPPGAK
jgi:hypothetical protein